MRCVCLICLEEHAKLCRQIESVRADSQCTHTHTHTHTAHTHTHTHTHTVFQAGGVLELRGLRGLLETCVGPQAAVLRREALPGSHPLKARSTSWFTST